MGRIRRGGYIFIWWIGDHPPRHVHVFDNDGKIITRVNLDTMSRWMWRRSTGRLSILSTNFGRKAGFESD